MCLGGFFMKTASVLALCLVIIGALVWLTVGIFNFNFVAFLFGAGGGAVVSRIIYSLVGLSGLWLIFYWVVYNPFRTLD
jgi:uncharacterized membrane protein YuzA (DUF378 family)